MVTRLLAKSYRGSAGGAAPPRRALLVEHSRDVPAAGGALANLVGAEVLHAAGLDAIDSRRFSRVLRANGWMQDVGKANDHFLDMVSRDQRRTQLIRHEAVSMLLFTTTALRDWIAPLGEDAMIAVWGAVGHHRRFGDKEMPSQQATAMKVFTSHPDLRTILSDMARDLGLGEPPLFTSDLVIGSSRGDIVAPRAFHQAKEDFHFAAQRYDTPETRRFVALVKAFGIAADVAASAIPRVESAAYSVPDYVTDALAKGRLTADDVQALIVDWAKKRHVDVATLERGAQCDDGRVAFQRRVADSRSTLTLATAGCGSGKSLAAYLWTKEWALRFGASGREAFRLFFCLPTTGTATEHFKDYANETGIGILAHSRASIDMQAIAASAPQEEATGVDAQRQQAEARRIEVEKIEALQLWSTPVVVATTDTVLGLMGNTLRSLCASPAILTSAIVFDEIHAFDDSLFGHLLVFIANFPRLPILLMTASLQPSRLAALNAVRCDLEIVTGPRDLEELERYLLSQIDTRAEALEAVSRALASGGKVLWVVNRVNVANAIYRKCVDRFATAYVQVYHSRFRYRDRSRRHRDVIDEFSRPGVPALLIATQVAEMSLDLSADLLVTDLAPIPALIQRFGRLNRRATAGSGAKPALIMPVANGQERPYTREDLEASGKWLDALRACGRAVSQHDLTTLADELQPFADFDLRRAELDAVFISGLWKTEIRAVRDEGHTISVILEEDWRCWKDEHGSELPTRDWLRAFEVSIPIRDPALSWSERAGYLPVAPASDVEYCWDERTQRGTGAEWRKS
jgi:CRISPR-associated endonuclease/helicase Cas3